MLATMASFPWTSVIGGVGSAIVGGVILLVVKMTGAGEATTKPAAALPPPGWHADPEGRARLRYWDGMRWTEHTTE
jgi:hypothetical protein